MQIVKLKISELKEYENNAKIHTDEQIDEIVKSIESFGMNDPIAVWRDDNLIVEGHGRVLALKKMGVDEVDCIRLDHLTEEERKAYTIAHNSTNMSTGFDMEILERELAELSNYDFADFGLSLEEKEKEVVEDDYEVCEEIEPRVKAGEVWQLGEHRLMCGDSTDEECVKKLMDGVFADMVLTDPPYNVDYEEKEKFMLKYRPNKRVEKNELTEIANDKKEDSEFLEFLIKAFKNMFDSLKKGGVWYIWYASREHSSFEKAVKAVGGGVRQQLIWNKNHFVFSRQDYQWKHEPCLYGWKDGASHYFVDDRTQTTVIEDKGIDFKKLKKDEAIKMLQEIYSDKVSTSVINEDKPVRNGEHPTMKPIKLLARLIKNSSKQNELVLDLFGGSGSTLIACEQLNRKCYTMELDEKYATVIVDRWEKLTNNKAVKI